MECGITLCREVEQAAVTALSSLSAENPVLTKSMFMQTVEMEVRGDLFFLRSNIAADLMCRITI